MRLRGVRYIGWSGCTAAPGAVPCLRSCRVTARAAGTMASFTTTDLLPVPQRPMTCQSSTISTSDDRQEKHPRLGLAGALDHAAEQNPLRVIDAAGKAPAAAQAKAARDLLGGAVRRDARRGDRMRIAAPDLALRLLRIIADHPVVLAMHGSDPGRRAAALRQRAEHLREHAIVGAVAAEHRRLKAAGELEALEVGDGFRGSLRSASGLRGALAQRRDERMGALDEDVGVAACRQVLAVTFMAAHHTGDHRSGHDTARTYLSPSS